MAVFDAWLRSVDEDLLGTGSFLADFGLKNINDLDVLSSVESEQIASVFEKAHVPPFQRNRLKNALDARRNAAMALKRKITGTPPQPPKNALTALDPDLVPKSSSGSAGRLSSPRVSESSADSSSASASASSRLVSFPRRARGSQLVHDDDYVASDGGGLTEDDGEAGYLRRIATTRPASRRSSVQTADTTSAELRGSKSITSFYTRSEAPTVKHGIGERASMESVASGRARLLSAMDARGIGAKCLVRCTGARENKVCNCDSQQAERCCGDWGCATRLEKIIDGAVVALRSAEELDRAPAGCTK